MPEKLVVSNASSLMNLAIISKLRLLKEFYGEIKIPKAVWKEVVVAGKGKKGTEKVEKAKEEGWLVLVDVEESPFLDLLKRDLDDGEAETIAWAQESDADLVLLDESDAREVAEIYNLEKTGVIGILIRAKLEGKIDSLREQLDRLQSEAGFWIDHVLYERALSEVGEASNIR